MMFRRRSAMASRRGVLHVHAYGDSPVPPDLVTWYTERGFHVHAASVRPPERHLRFRARSRRGFGDMYAELDATRTRLREVDGISQLIVTAHGAGANAAALWCDARGSAEAPDALLLFAPAFGLRVRRGLDIACPVLVFAGQSDLDERPRRGLRVGRTAGRHRDLADGVRLGAHVTWLRLPQGSAGPAERAAAERRQFFDEMGRWLGAYMYGRLGDQLI